MAKFEQGHNKVGGRKQGSKNKQTIEQELALDFLRDKVRERWEEIIDAQIDLAVGVSMEEILKSGEVRVYSEKPDVRAIEDLLDRVIGKPKEPIELSGQGLKELTEFFRAMANTSKKDDTRG